MEAVGLASSILTFIDVAYKILHGSYKVYKSSNGSTEENTHISEVVGDLSRVSISLGTNQQGLCDPDLVELSLRCSTLSEKLLELLKSFVPEDPSKKRQSFVAAWRIFRKQEEAVAMEKRLDQYRQQITLRLILLLLYVAFSSL